MHLSQGKRSPDHQMNERFKVQGVRYTADGPRNNRLVRFLDLRPYAVHLFHASVVAPRRLASNTLLPIRDTL
jgi:hypothetical protein